MSWGQGVEGVAPTGHRDRRGHGNPHPAVCSPAATRTAVKSPGPGTLRARDPNPGVRLRLVHTLPYNTSFRTPTPTVAHPNQPHGTDQ